MITPNEVHAFIISKGSSAETIKRLGETCSAFKTTTIVTPDTFIDRKVYGRYKAITDQAAETGGFLAYVQDDDVLTSPAAVVAAYTPGFVTCNMPPEFRQPGLYEPNSDMSTRHSCLVGFGAVFHSDLVSAAMLKYFRNSAFVPKSAADIFYLECDRVFTAFNRTKFISVPKFDLPIAIDPSRISMQPDHEARFAEIRRRIEACK